jgi:hypothetical protein
MIGTPTKKSAPRSEDFARGRSPTIVEALLPTPTATRYGSQSYPNDPSRKRPSLETLLKPQMMPTPVKPNGGRTLSKEAIETGKRANGQKAQIDTPNLLRYALETLPTPTKRDKRLDSWSPAYDRRKSPTMDAVMDGAITGRASDKWAGARALAQLLRSHGRTGTAALPVTYGWMMGFPPGWLARALRSAVAKGLLRPA